MFCFRRVLDFLIPRKERTLEAYKFFIHRWESSLDNFVENLRVSFSDYAKV